MKDCRRPLVVLAVFIAVMAVPSLVGAQPDVTGQWTSLAPLPFFPVHAHLLPTGKVMIWPGDGVSGNDPRAWDPATQAVTPLAKPGYDLFCTGHNFLADGRLLVAGGHIQSNVGLASASIYNPFNDTWTALPNMNAGRWYPTVTALPNGDALVVSGNVDLTVGINTLPQVFQVATGTWRNLSNAVLGFEYFPTMFVVPDGRVFMVGPTTATRLLDTSGTGSWQFIGHRIAFRDYGSAVMYADGKILTMGGTDPPSATAEVIDVNQPIWTWRSTNSMRFARRHLNALMLPDGKVLVTGGTSGPGFSNETAPVFAAELWDPATEQWTTLASATVPRLYHSTTVLLPDGRVLSMGGNGHLETEIFSPPYLFKGARPAITSAPGSVGYGQSFFVGTPNATGITNVTMIRLSSTTHAFNMGQHFRQLTFSQASGGLNVTAPANANLAPPGYYLLFVLNGSGVPSVASIVRLGGAAAPAPAPPPPTPPPAPPPTTPGPTLTALVPNTVPAPHPGGTLTVNGTNFVNGAVVRWNGANRTTTFVNSTQLQATIPGSDVAAPATVPVTVMNPDGRLSNALTFTVTGSGPSVSSLSPSTATAGSAAFTLTVNGTNFVNGSVVRWNGANRTTTFVSATKLTAAIPATDVAATGTPPITVVNPDGRTSNALSFTVTAPGATAPAPTLTALVPNSIFAGHPGGTLTVNGTNFVNGAVVRWNGANRSTTFVSSTQLLAVIPGTDVATAGARQVTVVNPDGKVSNALTFTVTP